MVRTVNTWNEFQEAGPGGQHSPRPAGEGNRGGKKRYSCRSKCFEDTIAVREKLSVSAAPCQGAEDDAGEAVCD